MMIRGIPRYGFRSKSIVFIIASCLLPLTSCSNQDPAFLERPANASLDGTAGEESERNAIGGPGGAESGEEGLAGNGSESEEKDTDGDGIIDSEETGENGKNGEDGSEGDLNLELVTANYTQSATSLVDILWIVDTSGSMQEEQDYLGTNFNSFIRGIAQSDLDFQTAVTSTDICPDSDPTNLKDAVCPGESRQTTTHLRGSFVGDAGRRVLKKGDSDLVTRFNRYTSLGINGSSFEHGLKAADMAVKKVMAGQNEDLIRDDAFLAVIVVSDEEDDGIGLGMVDAYNGRNFVELGLSNHRFTHTDFTASMKAIKGSGKFSVSTITGTRNTNGTMCSSAHSQPKEEGTQYIKAAKETGGTVQSICASDWDKSLYDLGQDIKSQISQITLARTPVKDSIKVYVDGSITTQWSYIEGGRVVKFLPGSIPPDGAAIRVEYLSPVGSK